MYLRLYYVGHSMWEIIIPSIGTYKYNFEYDYVQL